MAGFNSVGNRCRNRRNHNCSPCPLCGVSEHQVNWGKCITCGEAAEIEDYPYQETIRQPMRKHKRRRFDDED